MDANVKGGIGVSDLEIGELHGTDAVVDEDGGAAEDQVVGFCTARLAELPAAALLDGLALANCLNVSTRTLQRMTRRGQLPPGVKLGGRRIWMAGKVLEYLAAEADRLMASSRRLYLRRVDVGA